MKWLVFFKFQEKYFLFEEFRLSGLYVLSRTLCGVKKVTIVYRLDVGLVILKEGTFNIIL